MSINDTAPPLASTSVKVIILLEKSHSCKRNDGASCANRAAEIPSSVLLYHTCVNISQRNYKATRKLAWIGVWIHSECERERENVEEESNKGQENGRRDIQTVVVGDWKISLDGKREEREEREARVRLMVMVSR